MKKQVGIVCNIAFVGFGKYVPSISGTHTKVYNVWAAMIKRCYSEVSQKRLPTYHGVTVCDEWLNFQNFGEWFDKNYVEGFALDKDILFKGNKIYGPDTCCFVPTEINSLFTKHQNARGKLPIGIRLNSANNYTVQVNIDKKIFGFGTFGTIEEAFHQYKKVKEFQIKVVADRWKDKINERTYQALINYQVEITD